MEVFKNFLQVLFKPLLSAIGLHLGEVKTSAIMKKLGCHLSITAIMSSMRVDIVDSESNIKRKSSRGKGKGKRQPQSKFHLNLGKDIPVFFCDNFNAMVSMKDIINFEKKLDDDTDSRKKSKGAINIALDGLESKPTTTKVNFALDVNNINQHINVSLLRLVHQFVTMIMNIVETKIELKNHTSTDAFKGHRKTDSKGSSTETGEGDQPEFPSIPGMLELGDAEPGSALTPIPLMSTDSIPIPSFSSPLNSEVDSPGTAFTNLARPRELPLSTSSSKSSRTAKLLLQRGNNKYEVLSSQTSPLPSDEPGVIATTSNPESPTFGKSISIDIGGDTSSPAVAEKTIVDEIKDSTPQCWRKLYAMLDYYSTLPEQKIVNKPTTSRLSIIDEEPEKVSMYSRTTLGDIFLVRICEGS